MRLRSSVSYLVLHEDARLVAVGQMLQLISLGLLNLHTSVDEVEDILLLRADGYVGEVGPERLTSNVSSHAIIDTIPEVVARLALTGTVLPVDQSVEHHL